MSQKLKIKPLKWNIGRWQRTGCKLPPREAVGRSSATCRKAWASHWPGTPSIAFPLWRGPCPSRPGSTEAWLREQRHTPVKCLDEKREDSFWRSRVISLNIPHLKQFKGRAWLAAQISANHKYVGKTGFVFRSKEWREDAGYLSVLSLQCGSSLWQLQISTLMAEEHQMRHHSSLPP